jgi:hypothetical protein
MVQQIDTKASASVPNRNQSFALPSAPFTILAAGIFAKDMSQQALDALGLLVLSLEVLWVAHSVLKLVLRSQWPLCEHVRNSGRMTSP